MSRRKNEIGIEASIEERATGKGRVKTVSLKIVGGGMMFLLVVSPWIDRVACWLGGV